LPIYAAVDLAQHLLAIDVFGVLRAIAQGGGLAHRLGDLGSAHVPQFMQLGAQTRFAFRGDQRGTRGTRGAVTTHDYLSILQPSRSTCRGLALRARRVPSTPAPPISSAPSRGRVSSQG